MLINARFKSSVRVLIVHLCFYYCRLYTSTLLSFFPSPPFFLQLRRI